MVRSARVILGSSYFGTSYLRSTTSSFRSSISKLRQGPIPYLFAGIHHFAGYDSESFLGSECQFYRHQTLFKAGSGQTEYTRCIKNLGRLRFPRGRCWESLRRSPYPLAGAGTRSLSPRILFPLSALCGSRFGLGTLHLRIPNAC